MAGVSPKKAGTGHCGVPVFASAREAMGETGVDVSVLFIPPLGVKAAARDAIEAGCRRLVVLTEHVPVQDVMEMLALARANSAVVLGPNTAGLVTPGECFVAGAASPPGKKMGHAGAIVTGEKGTHASKRSALEAAGVKVLDTPSGVGAALHAALG